MPTKPGHTLFGSSGANFSGCGKYRFALWRIWDEDKPIITFVGLNPSTANEDTNDPTIRRVIRFANRWGYGGVYMMNLFPLVTPNPKDLLTKPIPKWAQRLNDSLLGKIIDHVVFAWGSFPEAKEKGEQIAARVKGQALAINKDGSPRHPLYVPAKTELIPYE